MLALALLAIMPHTTARPVRKVDQAPSLALYVTLHTSSMQLILGVMGAQASAPLAPVSLFVQLVSIRHTSSTLVATAHSAQATSLLGLLVSSMAQATLCL